LALDYNSSREQFAGVACVLVHYPCGDRFTTFQARTRIEIGALPATVKISVALKTRAVQLDGRWSLFSARCAL
jgi:hypothetical protein